MKDRIVAALPAAVILFAASANASDFTANAAATNNYIWRGLTQSENEAAVSGGIDYANQNGFYAGTWVSNVSFAPGDEFSYENDIYLGYAAEVNALSYDVGYLYYNYDEEAEFDFGEIYGSISIGGASLSLNLLANTEADEGPGQDFGFGEAYYLAADYGWTAGDDIKFGIHVGYQDGDFSEAFNGVPGGYFDYNASITKNGFTFLISGTDLDDPGPDGLNNDSVKFVVRYSMDFKL